MQAVSETRLTPSGVEERKNLVAWKNSPDFSQGFARLPFGEQCLAGLRPGVHGSKAAADSAKHDFGVWTDGLKNHL